jgi:hypothetical protein
VLFDILKIDRRFFVLIEATLPARCQDYLILGVVPVRQHHRASSFLADSGDLRSQIETFFVSLG